MMMSVFQMCSYSKDPIRIGLNKAGWRMMRELRLHLLIAF